MPSVFNKGTKILVVLSLLLAGFFVVSCGGSSDSERKTPIRNQVKPDTLSMIIKFDNSLFPIPSPYQAAALVKKNGIPFEDNLVNSQSNLTKYTTTFKKALNLGIYGTDISYLNIYERTLETIPYLTVIKKLSEELGLINAFDEKFFASLEKNMNNRDSLLVQMAQAYRKADSYLRSNDRKEMGALIITGGWIESLHILCKLATKSSDREIINRIGEQKYPLDNLIELLTPYYYKEPEYAKLIDAFIDLAYEFDGIIFNYSYREPRIDVENKLIQVNSESRVIMSEYHLKTISNKIELIRNQIIG